MKHYVRSHLPKQVFDKPLKEVLSGYRKKTEEERRVNEKQDRPVIGKKEN